MSEIKKDLLYTKDHEWVRKGDSVTSVVVGITDFAQAALGDVTFLQLPPVGTVFKRHDIVGSVESVKAVSDIFAPLSGTVSKINETLVADPAPLNTDPFGTAWLFELEVTNENEFKDLLTPDAYATVAQ